MKHYFLREGNKYICKIFTTLPSKVQLIINGHIYEEFIEGISNWGTNHSISFPIPQSTNVYDFIIEYTPSITNGYNHLHLWRRNKKGQVKLLGTENYIIPSIQVITDVHSKKKEFKQQKIDTNLANLVVMLGDMAEGWKVLTKPYIKWYRKATKKINIPFIWVKGNHECRGPLATIIPSLYFNKQNFFTRIGENAYLFLDTGENDYNAGDKMRIGDLGDFNIYRRDNMWKAINKTAKNSLWINAEKRFIFSHIPPLNNAWDNMIEGVTPEELTSILKSMNITKIYSGHYHAYSDTINEISNVITFGTEYPNIVK